MLLIENGELHSPAPLGRATIVVAGGRIEKIGDVDARAFAPRVIDATGCIVTPGLIDCHIHLIGGSGEEGFASATGPISAKELLAAGTTTVVGLLGTDTTTKTLPALLAKVKALREEGLNALMWTGGYDARSLMSCLRDDMVLFEEIIGAGEIAIADRRGTHHDARTLARMASDCYVAGTLTGKAGVLHLHTGEFPERLSVLHELLDTFGVPPQAIQPTHVNRNDELFREAIALTRRGVAVDMDMVEQSLAHWLEMYDGDRSMLTISTDAPIGCVTDLLGQIRDVVQKGIWPLEDALALATRNTARVLKLNDTGEIAEGKRADLLVLDAKTLAVRHVIAGGRVH
ncbi:MAG TPA: amidohydrolase family protein [Thermoanaerobaculia bacterium]